MPLVRVRDRIVGVRAITEREMLPLTQHNTTQLEQEERAEQD